MNSIHLGAIICFVLAILFYVIAWTPALWIVVVLGMVFELAAWLLVWFGPDKPVGPGAG